MKTLTSLAEWIVVVAATYGIIIAVGFLMSSAGTALFETAHR